MKYGLIVDFGQTFCNYGDLVQSIAIERIYSEMNIPSEQIVHLTKKDLSSYDGEPILLPFSYTIYYLIDFMTGNPELSDRIIPVFLGVSIESVFIYNCISIECFASENSSWLPLFRKHAPIGCRDKYTLHFMEEHGITAYLQGCISNIFPKRADGDYWKTILVDCPESVLKYIPSVLLEKSETLSNVVPIGDYSVEENFRRVMARYDYYRDYAAVVITSRYHVAIPCNAMGIPSVLIKSSISKYSRDIRWDAMPPNVQVYTTSDDYANIDWTLIPEDFPCLKESIIRVAIARIKEVHTRYNEKAKIMDFFTLDLSKYYTNKSLHKSYADVLRAFVSRYHNESQGLYYIWGAMDILCSGNYVELARVIKEINPNLDFAGWIDTYRNDAMLAGKPIMKSDNIELQKDDFIIVAAESAVQDARTYFKKTDLSMRNYVLLSEKMLSEESV